MPDREKSTQSHVSQKGVGREIGEGKTSGVGRSGVGTASQIPVEVEVGFDTHRRFSFNVTF